MGSFTILFCSVALYNKQVSKTQYNQACWIYNMMHSVFMLILCSCFGCF
uniref:Uncharacterized protein n=1 Tax=Rhizophora mucronata TaxID=61149 RepID=A0A2P2NK91_RHIMU